MMNYDEPIDPINKYCSGVGLIATHISRKSIDNAKLEIKSISSKIQKEIGLRLIDKLSVEFCMPQYVDTIYLATIKWLYIHDKKQLFMHLHARNSDLFDSKKGILYAMLKYKLTGKLPSNVDMKNNLDNNTFINDVITFKDDSQMILKLDRCIVLVKSFKVQTSPNCDYTNKLSIRFIGKNAYIYASKYKNFIDHDILINTDIYLYNIQGEATSKIMGRSRKSIFINNDIINNIINYIDSNIRFVNKYNSLCGLSKTTSILLYGKPGTGKSSFVQYIANHYKWSIVRMDINKNLNFDSINRLSNNIHSDKFIILIEDIDIIVSNRDENKNLESKRIFNALLQVLDGVASNSKAVVIATTNCIDKLDPALTREGRFDYKLELKEFETPELAEKMCNQFECSTDILKEMEYPINPAFLQSEIIKHLYKNEIE